jgi:hypothetical protein
MMRSISSMIAEVRSQTDEIRSFTNRLRNANRKLTGGTGEQPTPLASVKQGAVADRPDLPLLEDLNIELERLGVANADLRSEVTFLEGVSETADMVSDKGYASATNSR